MRNAEDMVREKNRAIISVPENALVGEALAIMTASRIGCVFATREGRIVGVWTERDLTRNVLSPGFDLKKTQVREVMNAQLRAAPCTDTVHNLMDKFLGLRIRRLLVEKDGEYIGMLTPGDVMKAILADKNEELKSLNELVSWEYYEEWKW